MSTSPATIEPALEIINGDLPLNDRAIDVLADLLIAAGEGGDGNGNTNHQQDQ